MSWIIIAVEIVAAALIAFLEQEERKEKRK